MNLTEPEAVREELEWRKCVVGDLKFIRDRNKFLEGWCASLSAAVLFCMIFIFKLLLK